jgi:pimeloyl-ACP methyl ester carboxylesterase
MVDQIHRILDHHGWTDFVMVAHSFGSIFATHLLRSFSAKTREACHPLVLVDPVTLSIHFAEIPYNFIYRKPRTASELLFTFTATDIGVCPAIMRLFDWTQNVLWLDMLGETSVTVFLAGKDAIIDTAKLRRYLERNGFRSECHQKIKSDSGVDVSNTVSERKDRKPAIVFHECYNHGELFLRSRGREDLVKEVLEHCTKVSSNASAAKS